MSQHYADFHRTTRMCRNGKSDPYLVVKLGDTVIKARKDYIPATTEPGFYQSFELRTTLPGPSLL
ncbi:MAG: hypothetical protein M9929_05855, partial [Burkholderiaceae bacterium]|nr:hypothetical protein [Burkholderiaceae bacterium]